MVKPTLVNICLSAFLVLVFQGSALAETTGWFKGAGNVGIRKFLDANYLDKQGWLIQKIECRDTNKAHLDLVDFEYRITYTASTPKPESSRGL